MPNVNDIKSGFRDRKGSKRRERMIYLTCPQCGKERWVQMTSARRKNFKPFCLSCGIRNYRDKHPMGRGENAINWRGGRYKASNGYIFVWLQPDDFFHPMGLREKRDWGAYVAEHRLVMAKHLGRNLHPWEIVHHKNHIRDDNRIDNLQLVTDDRHNQISILENKIARLETANKKLKSIIKLLS